MVGLRLLVGRGWHFSKVVCYTLLRRRRNGIRLHRNVLYGEQSGINSILFEHIWR